MRNGVNTEIHLDGKLHEIITYDVKNLSAYKLAGFFKDLLEKAVATGRDVIIRKDNEEIINVSAHEVYFIPENGWKNSSKQRDDYYGKLQLVVFDDKNVELDMLTYDDCYQKEDLDHLAKIDIVKLIVSDAVVIEIKTIQE